MQKQMHPVTGGAGGTSSTRPVRMQYNTIHNEKKKRRRSSSTQIYPPALDPPPYVALSEQKAPHREARKAPLGTKRHSVQSATRYKAPLGTKRHARRKRHT